MAEKFTMRDAGLAMRARALQRTLAVVPSALPLLVTALLPALLAAPARAAPVPQKPTLTPAEHAAAIIAPAMISAQVTWEGYVRQQVTGALLDDQSVTVTTRCEGVAVSSDGYLVLPGLCVDPDTVTESFYRQVAERRVAKGLATPDQVPALLADMFGNASVVGQPVNRPPKRTVTVSRGVATSAEALPATVVTVTPASGGDVALLKIEKSSQPIVHLASDVKPGLGVLTVEYPDSAQGQDAQPVVRLGSIATVEPRVTAYAGPTTGRLGAPVVTVDGELAGLVSRHVATSSVDQLTAADDIGATLAGAKGTAPKVSNDLAPLDTAYRAGLDAYIAGHYTESIEKFDAVLAIVPSHKQAHEFRDRAQALREAQGGPAHADNGLLQPVASRLGTVGPLVAAAVLVAVGLWLVRRRGHGRDATPPATPARTRAETPRYCTNCSNALPDEPDPACPTCGQHSLTRESG